MRSPRRSRRFSTYLLTVLFVTAQLVGFAHVSTERHEVCDEHGELVHVDHPSEAEAAPASGGPALRPAGEHESHDHCGLTPFVRETARPVLASAVPSGPAPAEVRGLVRETGEIERSVPLLLQAPKQSPPA